MNPLPIARASLRQPLYHCIRAQHGSSTARFVRNTSTASADKLRKRFNPYDEVNNGKITKEEVELSRRKFRATGIKLVLTIVAALVAYSQFPPLEELERNRIERERRKERGTHQADARPEDRDAFQGRPVVVAAGGQKLVAEHPETHEQIELVPTGTSYVPHFPKTINIPSPGVNAQDSEYTLLGLGIRRVSFLNIQVYIVGFYVKTTKLAALQSSLVHLVNPQASALIPGEKEQLKYSLSDPEESQRIWETVLLDKDAGIESAFRVVPVRDTNFNHLRDGWVTGINNRIQDATSRRQKALKEAGTQGGTVSTSFNLDDETMGIAMRSFKQLFSGRGKAGKGSIILLARDGEGNLDAFFQKNPDQPNVEKLGTLEDERIGRLIWQLYLGGKNVSSEEARSDVAQGVLAIVERPVGTVETQVL